MSADKKNQITPYQRLAEEFDKFRHRVRFPRIVAMFYYPKSSLYNNWSLLNLYKHTKSAEQLGYDVQLYAKDDGLHVKYVQKRPE